MPDPLGPVTARAELPSSVNESRRKTTLQEKRFPILSTTSLVIEAGSPSVVQQSHQKVREETLRRTSKTLAPSGTTARKDQSSDAGPPAVGYMNRKRPVNPILIGYRVVGNLLIDPIPSTLGWHETLQTYGGTDVSDDRAV